MTSYVPPIKNGASGWIGYVSLAPRVATGAWRSNPTLATGDVKISIDGGTLANLTTLPAVTPASSKLVKITLSQAETNGDNLTIIFSDAAGAEWCDLTINLQTVARQIDDLAFPNTSGRGITVDASGNANANLVNIAGSAVSTTTAQLGVNVVNAAGTAWGSGAITAGAIAADAITAAKVAADVSQEIRAEMDANSTKLANLDATISSRLASASYTAPLDAAGTRSAVGLASANLDTQLGTIAGYIDTEVAAIKAKTDLIPGDMDGLSLTEMVTLFGAALLGKVSGAATATVVFRAADDSKDRITATVDADGNRTAVTLDAA